MQAFVAEFDNLSLIRIGARSRAQAIASARQLSRALSADSALREESSDLEEIRSRPPIENLDEYSELLTRF